MSLLPRTTLSTLSSLRSSLGSIASTSFLRLSSSTPPAASPSPDSPSAAPSPSKEVPYSRFHVQPLKEFPAATWVHPPSSTLAGTPIPEVVIFKTQPIPVAMEDDAYPSWLWKLVGEGAELVKAGKEPAERGAEFDSRESRRILRASNKSDIKVANLLKKR